MRDQSWEQGATICTKPTNLVRRKFFNLQEEFVDTKFKINKYPSGAAGQIQFDFRLLHLWYISKFFKDAYYLTDFWIFMDNITKWFRMREFEGKTLEFSGLRPKLPADISSYFSFPGLISEPLVSIHFFIRSSIFQQPSLISTKIITSPSNSRGSNWKFLATFIDFA